MTLLKFKRKQPEWGYQMEKFLKLETLLSWTNDECDKLIILEDPTPNMIAEIGGKFKIDPQFWADFLVGPSWFGSGKLYVGAGEPRIPYRDDSLLEQLWPLPSACRELEHASFRFIAHRERKLYTDSKRARKETSPLFETYPIAQKARPGPPGCSQSVRLRGNLTIWRNWKARQRAEDEHQQVYEPWIGVTAIQRQSSRVPVSAQGFAAKAQADLIGLHGVQIETGSYRYLVDETLTNCEALDDDGQFTCLIDDLKYLRGAISLLERRLKRDQEFLRSISDDFEKERPKTWFREHPILAMNFVFWVIVHGIADRAFKGISSVEELLAQRPPKGRESWTLQWAETAKELPFFRMVTPNGPKADKGLTFSSLRHNFTSLAQRDGFKDQLCVHGIRAELANRVDPKASEATRSQALDHQDHTTFLKYQAQLKALDMQALMYGMEPDYECRDMEQSMAHHRDPNVPLRLDAVTLHEFEHDEEILRLNTRIADLSRRIAGQPSIHKSLAEERARLYTQKAKKLRAKRSEYISQWWNNSYEGYISGKGFSERDTTNLFEIFAKYIPTRTRLRENLFKEVPLDMLLGNCKIAQSIFYNAGGRH
ncbi:hypothetical protein KXX67_002465 [Aspergillus fumigatus]|nr:hypothetical protein KXX67_002465 [Aspergillus fumigatus]KAH2825883.1 hypothetical protein KXW76_002169 [Aspergillus fumigatus]